MIPLIKFIKIKQGGFMKILVSLLMLWTAQSFAITNGIEIPESTQPAIRYLKTTDMHYCTGSFVSPNTMITNRHCLERGLDRIEVDGIKAIDAFYLDDLSCTGTDKRESEFRKLNKYDVALVIFPDNTGVQLGIMPDEYIKLSGLESNILNGREITLYGFGRLYRNDVLSGRRKRMGTNNISEVTTNYIEFSGFGWPTDTSDRGINVGLGKGDSGLPVIDSQTGEAIAIFSNSYTNDGDDVLGTKLYSILTHSAPMTALFSAAIDCKTGSCSQSFPFYKVDGYKAFSANVVTQLKKAFVLKDCKGIDRTSEFFTCKENSKCKSRNKTAFGK